MNFNNFLPGLIESVFVLEAIGVESEGFLVTPALSSENPVFFNKISLINQTLNLDYPKFNNSYETLKSLNG